MKYPELLRPESVEHILLPSGKLVEVHKTTPIFTRWEGDPLEDTYGGKPILSFRGEPVFAELAILRAFQGIGWDGVWVDTFGRKHRAGYWGTGCTVELPSEQEVLLGSVYERAGASKGCWDVFCWKDERRLFAEAKWQDRDQIRDSQRRWLEAAIAVGLHPSSFLVVEWSA
jgi:hypothetical protein